MNTYVFRYRELTDPEDAITHSVYISAPNTRTAWLLFEATYPPKKYIAVGITYRSHLVPT